jgi:hypothetical protein
MGESFDDRTPPDRSPQVAYSVKELFLEIRSGLQREFGDLKSELKEQNRQTGDKLVALDERLKKLEAWQANITGRLTAAGLAIGLLVVVVNVALKFWGVG